MDFLSMAGQSDSFMPHGHCYLWTPSILWTYVVSDSLIGLAYYSIPIALTLFVKKRRDLQFSWVFVLFSIFIFACGTTHFVSIWTIWHPDYAFDAGLKGLTALASILTAVLLWPLIPKAIALPSPTQLREALYLREQEIAERKRFESELATVNEELEQRVAERTMKLQDAERRLQDLLIHERGARVEAERVGRMKDEFLMTLSHELRTPLNAILGWVQIMKDRSGDLSVVEKGIDVIDRNLRLQTKLINDLLDMSSIIAGKIRLSMQPVRLGEVIDAAIESLRPALQTKSIRLTTDFDPAIHEIEADGNRLQQVMWNLLSNAIKYTPRGGNIRIDMTRAGSDIEITVTDDGEGISPDFLPLLFERFSQADSSTRRKHDGLGLGLSIAKTLVDMHGGTITARSEGEGKGAVFLVRLPELATAAQIERRRQVAQSAPAYASPVTSTALSEVRILVVDDELDARELVKVVLESHGARVMMRASASEARACLEAFQPQLIVCDIGMPEEDGYDFLRAVRQRGIKVPAVALTAFVRSEDRIQSLNAGYQAHLTKPLEQAELIALAINLTKG